MNNAVWRAGGGYIRVFCVPAYLGHVPDTIPDLLIFSSLL